MPEAMTHADRTRIYTAIYTAATKALKSVGEPETMTPAEVDNHRMRLAALYAMMSEEIGRMEMDRAELWLDLKLNGPDKTPLKKPNSDKMTDLLFDCTEQGKKRIEARYCVHGLEKVLSALSSHLRRLQEEIRNNY